MRKYQWEEEKSSLTIAALLRRYGRVLTSILKRTLRVSEM